METKAIPSLFDLSFSQLQEKINSWDEPAYRTSQIWDNVYRQYNLMPELFKNIPRTLRNKLEEELSFSTLQPLTTLNSKDGYTSKALFNLADNYQIETVLMKYNTRRTLCISSQVGCGMGCVFCATGQMGYKRNLSKGEIIEQVMSYAISLNKIGEKITNIVVMGMGEPFHNYDQTMAAIDILNDSRGLNMGERRFTISTVGIIPGITRFTQEKRQINLAISLHAANDDLRSRLLPINKKYPLSELIRACRDYVNSTRRRLTFEWALIDGINDSPDHAKELSQLIRGLLAHVNVIPLNPSPGYSGTPSSQNKAREFLKELEDFGIPCTIRVRRGLDIHSGCGQLATALSNSS
jgi:23S rRNA (adenine2503-C2)-methyltransferase